MGDSAKKRKMPVPCFTCTKEKKANCNGEKPCNECIKLGQPRLCFPVDGSGVGSPRKNGIAPQPQSKQISNVSNTNMNNNNSMRTNSTPTTTTTNNVVSSNSISNNPPPFKTNNAQTIVGVPRSTTTQSEMNKSTTNTKSTSDSKGSELDPQSAINLYFMGEMKRMKEEIKKMNDEMLTMRMQNLKLSSAVESLKPTILNNESSQWLLPTNSGCGMVVIDLRQNPPIILTANDIFCEMLGYSLEEVVGKPWHKFMYQPYIEQTYNKFSEMSRDASSGKIVLNQVYVTKSSELFPTIDTHQLFFAGGKPISDLVFVTLPQTPSASEHQSVRPTRDPLLLTGPDVNSLPNTPIDIDQIPIMDDTINPLDNNLLDTGGFHIQSYDDLSNLGLSTSPPYDLTNNYHVDAVNSPQTEFDTDINNFDPNDDWLLDPTIDFQNVPK